MKKVTTVLPASPVNMGGIIVKQALPKQSVQQVDPFLLLHHATFTFNEFVPAIKQGIGPHPHRGFSPVTFVINGEVHHRDSRGNNQIAKKGEVQWMNAGAGIVHSERPSENLVKTKGKQEVIQLWVNSPANKKMEQPLYQFASEAAMPTFLSDDKRISHKLVAGTYNGLKSTLKTASELLIIWATAEAGGKQVLQVPTHYNTALYLISGELNIAGYGITAPQSLVVFDNNAENIAVTAKTNAAFLLLAGVPLNEKLVQHGPYVMNSETEILRAMRDYQMGKMGVLIEDK